jgi:hypothetical protein
LKHGTIIPNKFPTPCLSFRNTSNLNWTCSYIWTGTVHEHPSSIHCPSHGEEAQTYTVPFSYPYFCRRYFSQFCWLSLDKFAVCERCFKTCWNAQYYSVGRTETQAQKCCKFYTDLKRWEGSKAQHIIYILPSVL